MKGKEWEPPKEEEAVKAFEMASGAAGTDEWTGKEISALPIKTKKRLAKIQRRLEKAREAPES